MLQEQIMLYIRENLEILFVSAGTAAIFLLLLVFIQVTRTRREVHKICKKIRRYFDVVLSEEEPEIARQEEPAAQAAECGEEDDWEEREKMQKAEEDAQLLMDVLSEVF